MLTIWTTYHNNMNILIVYLFCTKGGVETAINNRLEGLNSANIKIDLLFFQNFGGEKVFANYKAGRVIIENDFKKIKKNIRDEGYDAIVLLDTYQMIPVLQEMGYPGKVVLEAHSTYPETLEKIKYLKSEEVDYISVPSNYQKKLVEKYLNAKIPIYTLPNSLDLNLFSSKDITDTIERKILLWVGRLDEHKNWKAFLDICSEILKKRKEYEFWLVGGLHSQENQKEEFQKKILDLDLYCNIKWIPACSYEKISNIYNYVRASGGGYVVTSKNESFGMTVLEAMACGCPVIVNNVGALPELVNSQRGLVIDVNAKRNQENAKKIIEFLESDLTKTTSNALEYVGKYSNKKVFEMFIDYLSAK